MTHQNLYLTVQRFTQVPWFVVASIHFCESSLNFKRHLHNGDPLTDRTVHVPQGRPVYGQPPFTWIESAVDAFDSLWRPRFWDVSGALEFMERYNGLGYQKRGINTPYLWGYTDKYTKGLYVADGKFDPEKVDQGPGCVAVVKTLSAKGVELGLTLVDANGNALH